ncbi:EF-hand domain-containing protein [Pontixanthobacter luteolus]|uniref:EF-hand domain-containing protein n=1 Tax=Pontixanthobacter luteolus TaxID=295089 RepID=UPI0023039FFC|nr:EF-hand domain-containing protein [Pontixanthobacter luteolus]
MNRMLLGGLGALLLVSLGLFWWQGRAQVEESAPPPEPVGQVDADDTDTLPNADVGDMQGPTPPEATELSREQRRFFRYDRNRDLKISRNEMLSTRSDAFRKLDKDGNNLLTFEEWAVATATRFDGADANGDRELTAEEFATTRPKPKRKKPACRC